MQAEFLDTANWHESYQRNNKGGGLKNLRCFPHCKNVHVERGYCGAPVYLDVNLPQVDMKTWKDQFIAVAQFRAKDIDDDGDHHHAAIAHECGHSDNGESSNPPEASILHDVSAGSSILSSGLFSELTTKNPKRIFRGELEVDTRFEGQTHDKVIVFNVQNKGWNYSWHGTKHTSKTIHCLSVYLFQFTEPSKSVAACVAVFDSPEFTVYSRRKKRMRRDKDDDSCCVKNQKKAKQPKLEHQPKLEIPEINNVSGYDLQPTLKLSPQQQLLNVNLIATSHQPTALETLQFLNYLNQLQNFENMTRQFANQAAPQNVSHVNQAQPWQSLLGLNLTNVAPGLESNFWQNQQNPN